MRVNARLPYSYAGIFVTLVHVISYESPRRIFSRDIILLFSIERAPHEPRTTKRGPTLCDARLVLSGKHTNTHTASKDIHQREVQGDETWMSVPPVSLRDVGEIQRSVGEPLVVLFREDLSIAILLR